MVGLPNSKKFIWALVIIALVAIQVALPSSWTRVFDLGSLAATTITLIPSSVSLAVGDDTWITIRINDVEDLYGADVRLAFDASVIEVIDEMPGGTVNLEPGTMPYPDFPFKNQADNTIGDIWYVVTQTQPRPPASGSGTLARIHIRGLNDGATTLHFTHHDLASSGGQLIPSSVNSCFIEVGSGAPTATDTSTPILTTTPTSTDAATATTTGTLIATNTPTVTPTEGPSPTPTTTPTITQTPTPTMTGLPTVTPTITATPAERTFGGYVYRGALNDTSQPLPGVEVWLHGSWVEGHPGTYLGRSTTNAQGHFGISYVGSYPHYSLVEIDPPGYRSTGAIAGSGGRVADSTNNWVEFRNAGLGSYEGTMFFDTPSADNTPTATPGGGTGTPSATSPPPDVPIYVGQRAARDTFLNALEPDENYGGQGHLHFGLYATGPIKNVLLWFDLDDIPSDALVTEATLSLFGRSVDGIIPLCAYGLRRDWEEHEATWHEARTDDPWYQDGAMDGSEDRDGECIPGTFIDGEQIQFYEWDIRSLVQAWVSGARPNLGLVAIIGSDSKAKDKHGFYSREYSEFALRPFLSLVYIRPTPTPTVTPTATLMPSPTVSPTKAGFVSLPLIVKPGA